MIVGSCSVISCRDIEQAFLELLSQSEPPLPTPGVVYRHLAKKMNCCGCAPLTVSTIYSLVEKLEREGRVCPYACATAKAKLVRFESRKGGAKLDSPVLIAAE